VPRLARTRRRRARAALLHRGEVAFSRLRFAEALDAADGALGVAPEDAEAHMLRAKALHHLGQDGEVHRERAHDLLRASGDRALAAANAVEGAVAAARVGRQDRVDRWLRAVREVGPEAYDEAARLPGLAPHLALLDA
jgi:hypothetical protein